MMRLKSVWFAGRAAACVALLIGPVGCQKREGAGGSGEVELAFITNSPSDFWTIARAGVAVAEKEFGVKVHFQVPGKGSAAEQKQIIEAMIAKGVKGMAISPLDSESQVTIIDEAAAHMPVVTQDSDAPKSKRVAYVGTNNVEAGRKVGKLIKDVLPKGGKIAVFVGKMDVANARERYAGIMEELKGAKIEVVTGAPYTDENSYPKAQENVRVALDKFPDVGCLVGLWSYNGPMMVKVVKEKGSKVPIVCFDEEGPTLQGIREGLILATVVQQPYQFGYDSIRVLAKLAKGEPIEIPKDGLMYVPTKVIRKANVDEFEKKLNALKARGR
ncbi:MAG: sugar-binding protein [Phycisphaerae bacterium]|nr:sugar-binding protein [Phycisphaerae bacterium]